MTERHETPRAGATDNVRLIADVVCGPCHGEGHWYTELSHHPHYKTRCRFCQGTGYRFPWLWRECGCPCHKGIYQGTKFEGLVHLHGCKSCTGYVLIEGDAAQWVALAKVALTIPKAIIVTPPEWDEALPESWVKVGEFDPEALATALVAPLGLA